MHRSLLLAIVVLLTLHTVTSLTTVTTGQGLIDCLNEATLDNDECRITVASITLTSGSATLSLHKRVTSSLPSGSTVDAASFPLARVADNLDGDVMSLSIDGITFINTGAPITGNFIEAVNTEMNLTNSVVRDFALDNNNFMYGENSTGHWENNLFKNVNAGANSFYIQQDMVWTFINQTFDNVYSYSSYGILHFNTYFSDRPGGGNVTFGGNITFVNCAPYTLEAPYIQDAAIGITHDTYTPVHIFSHPTNPSRFNLQNSNMSLFVTSCRAEDTLTSIEVGSIYADSYLPGNTNDTERYLFMVDPWDQDTDPPQLIARSSQTSLSVLTTIESHGIGIVSRGYGFPQGPSSPSYDPELVVGVSITVSYDGNLRSAFRLLWPMTIRTADLTANLLPRASDGLVGSFLLTSTDSSLFTDEVEVLFAISGLLSISSTNTGIDYNASPLFSPTTLAPSAPASPSASAPASVIPHVDVAPIYIANGLLTVTFNTGFFSMSNFTRLPSNGFDASSRGAAVCIEEGSLYIRASYGDIQFSGNQNTAGPGGAIWATVNVQTFYLDAANGNIAFSDNTAYYGGGLYIESDVGGEPFFHISANQIQLLRNTAVDGGGAVLLPYSFVFDLFPPTDMVIINNGAGGFGCVFAFNINESLSDTAWGSSCSDPTYTAGYQEANYRLSSNYKNSTHCPYFETLCSAAPAAPPTAPINPPATPAAPSPAGCRQTTNVPAGATCVNGVYQVTTQSFITYVTGGTTGSAPQIDAPIVISGGNVTLPSLTVAKVFSKSRSTAMITSTDCIQIASLSVSLSSDDISEIQDEKSITSTLIQSSCAPNGTIVLAVGAKPKKSCQSNKIDTTETATTLQATFTVASSGCNNWWIILVSVICGVILLVIIAVVIILLLPEEYRAKLQPFHKTKDAPVASKARVYSNID